MKKEAARIFRFIRSFEKRLKYLLKGEYAASFPQEITEILEIPRYLALSDMALQLSNRSNHEVLLRIVAARILRAYRDTSSQALIDIGAWIGDNSLVWSKLTQKHEDWKIIAIDPSSRNISFIRKIAAFNYLSNIDLCQCLCSASEGSLFDVANGNINHGSFKEAGYSSSAAMSSTTLNNVYYKHSSKYNLLLIHLDVEGCEYDVLSGADQLLDRFSPFVIYEGHIKNDSEMLEAIRNTLTKRNYTIWMINEILPGCDLDCRNFLAIPRSSSNLIDDLQLAFREASKHHSFFPATTDQAALLKV